MADENGNAASSTSVIELSQPRARKVGIRTGKVIGKWTTGSRNGLHFWLAVKWAGSPDLLRLEVTCVEWHRLGDKPDKAGVFGEIEASE